MHDSFVSYAISGKEQPSSPLGPRKIKMEIVVLWTMVELLLALILIVALGFVSAVFFEAHRRRHNNAYFPISSSSLIFSVQSKTKQNSFFLACFCYNLCVFQARRCSGDLRRPEFVETGTCRLK